LLDRARAGRSPVAPTFISNYLNAYGPMGEVSVETGAWNTGWQDGRDFIQWTGSSSQKTALKALNLQNQALNLARARIQDLGLEQDEALARDLEEATWRLLRAETSCNFYWGEAWVDRSEADLVVSRQALERVEGRLPEMPSSLAPAETASSPDPEALARASVAPETTTPSDPTPSSSTPTEGSQP
ncbi:MAG: glycoside hydrolase family 57, partial [Chromatiaceae bacterium]